MNRYILILTMGREDLINRLLSPLYWESTEGATTIILNQGGQKVKVSRKAIVHHSDENLGCAGGRTFLVDRLLPDLQPNDQLVFLDDDVEVLDRYWLWRLCAPLSREYGISGVGGRNITPDFLTEATTDRHPDYVSGGWCAIRGDVFLDGITWDLRFNPCYYEDIDFCWESRAKGKLITCVSDVGLRHEHTPNEAAAQLVAVNRQKFIEKWANVDRN